MQENFKEFCNEWVNNGPHFLFSSNLFFKTCQFKISAVNSTNFSFWEIVPKSSSATLSKRPMKSRGATVRRFFQENPFYNSKNSGSNKGLSENSST